MWQKDLLEEFTAKEWMKKIDKVPSQCVKVKISLFRRAGTSDLSVCKLSFIYKVGRSGDLFCHGSYNIRVIIYRRYSE